MDYVMLASEQELSIPESNIRLVKRYPLLQRTAEALLGAHISIAGGVHLAPARGQELGCTAMQIFLKNALQWKAKPYTEEEISQFKNNRAQSDIRVIMAHDTYLINLGSPDTSLLKKSRQAFLNEVNRSHLLGIPHLITHPGAHGGIGEHEGIKTIAESLDYIFSETKELTTQVLLETTAGQGTTVGHTFEHLARIIDLVESKTRVGVCLDTCHIFAAGYDIQSEDAYQRTMDLFNQILGLENLKAFHLNDSKRKLNSRVDRHQHIGLGQIGSLAFKLIMTDSRFQHIPKIIETPKENGQDYTWDRKNLNLLRSFLQGSGLFF